MQGKFCIKGMNFHAFHGTLEVERELGQVFSINATIGFPLSEANISPSAEEPIRGAHVYEQTRNVVMGSRFVSYTSLALAIAKALFVHLENAETVSVTISRRQIFIPGTIDEVAAEVICERRDFFK